jgi:ribosome-associated protein
MEPNDLALLAADVLYEHKAVEIAILDVDRILVITSCFVIATGTTRRHLQGLADSLTKELRERGIPRRSQEGYEDGQWVLLDFGDIVVHLFEPEARQRYALEDIWADAPRLAWQPRMRPAAPAEQG